ncbi:neuropeptides capa receptor-like [Cephus cinctus]|uniref:Neuropeptides capa receptor-like n=1 Tax=Cephus cinctus TaxID=211228 RepID=A0AAJ7BSX1_CEPCN|nr:neuropeptides capa receptor-like [Cephus cinctus]
MEPSSFFPTPVGNMSEFMNLSESEYLRMMLGPKRLPLKAVLPVTVVYGLIFVTGIIGNLMTCIVITKNSTMQTATNYYLFSLAVSDLTLLLLGLPNEISVFWQQYPWIWGLKLCRLRAFVSEMSSYVSVLTIVAFSMERYLAICHPLHPYAMSGLKRPIRFILGAWIIALVCAIPFAVYTNINYMVYPPGSGRISNESAVCAMLLHNMPKFPLYEISCLIFFLVPMVLIMVLYIRMGLKIQSNTLGPRVEGSVHGETRQAQSRKAIIRMLSAVVITFFICWVPFHAQRLLYVYADRSIFGDINEWLYPLGGCLYYCSATINPILYNVMSAKYRSAFKEMLCCSMRNGSSSLGRDEQSSIRETTVFRYNSRRGSHQVRVRSLRCNRPTKNHSCVLDRASEKPPFPGDVRLDTEEPHCNSEDTKQPLLKRKKSSSAVMVVKSSNGRQMCRAASDNNGGSGETRI